jgi:hypothetical protein
LERNQFTFRKYIFNRDSIFMEWLRLGEQTRMIFLFRRLNTCRHRHSCAESVLRRFYRWVAGYTMIRVPLYYIFKGLFYRGTESHFMLNKNFLIGECLIVALSALIYAGLGCLLRYLNEEIVEGGVGGNA